MASKNKQTQKRSRQTLDPDPVEQNREAELRELSLSELQERYLNTFQKEAVENEAFDEEGQKEELIQAILAGSPAPPAKQQPPEGAPLGPTKEKGDKVVKTKDGREHVVKASDKHLVHVRQVQLQRVSNDLVELPSTEQFQTYDKKQFQKMLDDNFFSDSQMRVEVLHKP